MTSGFGSSAGWTSIARHHVGKGPKNYQRSDARIEEEVCDRLTADPMVDATDLECKVKDGEVTLTGTVRTREEKRRAEDVAESITGVKDVNNQVRVKKSSDRDDETIAGARSSSSTPSSGSTSSTSGTPGMSASSSSGRGNR